MPRREETEDGFERQLATNYLGHFALAGLLLPHVRQASSSRIVPVASIAHRRARLHLDDLQMTHSYRPMEAYGQTKLAMLMFGLELDRRLKAAGSRVRSVPAHPGVASTDITRRGDRAGSIQRLLGAAIFRLIGQSAAHGALPLLFATSSPNAEGGVYYGPDGIGEARGCPTKARIAPHAFDQEAAPRLWSASQELTGVKAPL